MALKISGNLIIDDDQNLTTEGIISSPTIDSLVNTDTYDTAARIAADLLLQNSLDSIIDLRISGDTLISDFNIAAEATARADADTELWNAIGYYPSAGPVVKIGTQFWMVKNLNVEQYNDGTPIPTKMGAQGDSSPWYQAHLAEEGARVVYNGFLINSWGAVCNDPELWESYPWYDQAVLSCIYNEATYGHLYNWHVISEGENHGGVCPEGFHVASKDEWVTMFEYITSGMQYPHMISDKLKEAGMEHWCGCSPMTGAEGWCSDGEGSPQGCHNYPGGNPNGNTSGFTALPAGYRAMVVYESYPWVSRAIRDLAYFWTSTEYSEDTTKAHSIFLKSDSIAVNNGNNFDNFPDVADYKGYGFSIRCIAD